MTRKYKKPKAGHQKSKRRKAPRHHADTASASGGAMSSLRGSFKSLVRGGGRKDGAPSTLSKVIDWALWAAVAGAVVYFISNAKCS